MGMCGGASYGLVSGFIIYTMPQALAAQHVPETRITYITAVADSPMVFIFLLSPILDVWLSRRSYASVLTTVAVFLVGISVTSLRHLPCLHWRASLERLRSILRTLQWADGFQRFHRKKLRIS